jgi:cell division protein FtsB
MTLILPVTFNNDRTVLFVDHLANPVCNREVLAMLSPRLFSIHSFFRLAILATLGFSANAALTAQEQTPAVDKETLQALLKRVDQLEARVKQLEAERQMPVVDAASSKIGPPSVGPLGGMDGAITANGTTRGSGTTEMARDAAGRAATLQNAAAQAASQSSNGSEQQPDNIEQPSDNVMMERMDVSRTLLRIRGFGDISLHGSDQKGDTTSFSLGQLDLFVTSDVSDKFKFISEIVFEGGPNNIYGRVSSEANSFSVDVERYLLQYSHNDFLNISAGRVHTAIGYYNTAYHHSSWLQTTTGRPFIFDFEDHGGILPIHMVGASASGQIPSGSLGLHYVAEVGNGRASRQPLEQEPVQNEIDDKNHKAFNLALFARPEEIRGLQAGFSFYHDLLDPQNLPRISESILAGHVVLVRPKYEWLNEALIDRHVLSGTSTSFNTPGFYSQVSKQFASYRPYLRYQYVNVSNREPIFSDVALRHGPSAGLRFDASESVALKFQYDYTFLRNQPGISQLALQMGFTF